MHSAKDLFVALWSEHAKLVDAIDSVSSIMQCSYSYGPVLLQDKVPHVFDSSLVHKFGKMYIKMSSR